MHMRFPQNAKTHRSTHSSLGIEDQNAFYLLRGLFLAAEDMHFIRLRTTLVSHADPERKPQQLTCWLARSTRTCVISFVASSTTPGLLVSTDSGMKLSGRARKRREFRESVHQIQRRTFELVEIRSWHCLVLLCLLYAFPLFQEARH